MTYSKMLKQTEREYKNRKKEEKKQDIIKRQKQEEFKIKLYAAQVRQEKQEQEQMQKDKEIYITEARNYLEYMGKNYPYKVYIIAWDIIHNDFYSLESDLHNAKITFEQLKEVYQIAKEKISKLEFSIELLTC